MQCIGDHRVTYHRSLIIVEYHRGGKTTLWNDETVSESTNILINREGTGAQSLLWRWTRRSGITVSEKTKTSLLDQKSSQKYSKPKCQMVLYFSWRRCHERSVTAENRQSDDQLVLWTSVVLAHLCSVWLHSKEMFNT